MKASYILKKDKDNLEKKDRCHLVCLPTGMGKTITFCSSILDLWKSKEAKSILFLVHTEELVDQIIDTLKNKFHIPAKKIDKVVRTCPRNRQITVSTIQSFTADSPEKKGLWRAKSIIAPDIIIIDECHRSAAHTYQKVIDFFLKSIVFGFTATPIRVKDEFKKIFADTWQIIYNEYTLKKAIEEGYLCNIKYYRINTNEDDDSIYLKQITEKYKELGGGKFLIFANSVSHSMKIQNAFRKIGVSAYHVDGCTKKKDRKRILDEFKNYSMLDDIILTNYNVYTAGVDIPDLQGVIIACKLTNNSIVRFLQMVGRVTRNYKTVDIIKEFGIVLEVRNNKSKRLIDSLDRIFRIYYQEKDQIELDQIEEEIIEEEKEEAVFYEETYNDIEKIEIELQNFFSPLPQSLISSNLNWISTIDEVFTCNISKTKRIEIIKEFGNFIVIGINEHEKKRLREFENIKEADEYCNLISEKFYISSKFIWSKSQKESWKNQPATEKQKKALERLGYKCDLTKLQASRILEMNNEKKRREPISIKQRRLLYVLGFKGDYALVNKSNIGVIIKELQRERNFNGTF